MEKPMDPLCHVCENKINGWFFQHSKTQEKYCIECSPTTSKDTQDLLKYYSNLTEILKIVNKKLDNLVVNDQAYNNALLTEFENVKRLYSLDPHKQVVALFDMVLVDLLFKHTGLDIDDILAEITNKELKRILNNLKKERIK